MSSPPPPAGLESATRAARRCSSTWGSTCGATLRPPRPHFRSTYRHLLTRCTRGGKGEEEVRSARMPGKVCRPPSPSCSRKWAARSCLCFRRTPPRPQPPGVMAPARLSLNLPLRVLVGQAVARGCGCTRCWPRSDRSVPSLPCPLTGTNSYLLASFLPTQVLAPSLLARGRIFGGKLALKAEWLALDSPYFSAPGEQLVTNVPCGQLLQCNR